MHSVLLSNSQEEGKEAADVAKVGPLALAVNGVVLLQVSRQKAGA